MLSAGPSIYVSSSQTKCSLARLDKKPVGGPSLVLVAFQPGLFALSRDLSKKEDPPDAGCCLPVDGMVVIGKLIS
jgi:hypothetical protein